jgi:predicted metallo-beta-lactamase superfamily hydrolase
MMQSQHVQRQRNVFTCHSALAVDGNCMLKLNKIKVTPLAAESFGVRSMCTLVETPDVTLLLDAGVSLCPYRFGLPPHPIEFQTIDKLRRRIAEAADKAEAVTISHYHFDHHTPSYEDWLVNWTEPRETARQIYQDKKVLLKNPRENINASQRKRAWLFQKTGGKYAKTLETADGKTFVFGKETILRFSEAVPHGPDDSMLGWVVMALIECQDELFMFAPDVQGPMSTHTLELIKAAKPQVIMLGGPPFYLGGFKVDEAQLQLGLKNLTAVVEAVPLTVLEHHALRDAAWQQRTKPVYAKAAEMGHKVMTAAEFAGDENTFLESKRKMLYVENPPSKEFEKWMREGLKAKSYTKPPYDL